MKSFRTILAVAALLTCAHMASAQTTTTCTKGKPVITTDDSGRTIITTPKVCVVVSQSAR
jgi:ABC-type Fe3+-hydroxamate transport system substrate-binding protein